MTVGGNCDSGALRGVGVRWEVCPLLWRTGGAFHKDGLSKRTYRQTAFVDIFQIRVYESSTHGSGAYSLALRVVISRFCSYGMCLAHCRGHLN